MAVATRPGDSRLDPSAASPFSAVWPPNLLFRQDQGQAQLENYSDWYLGDPSQRWIDPARDAFDNAVKALQSELSSDEYQAIWLRGQTSVRDVHIAVTAAMEEYKSKAQDSKVRKWLSNCSSRIMYYGAIFDMFSSHHPEYVSLAWGTMKFLFIAVLNHEELLTEISKTIARIADVLPRTELLSVLYPTPRMQEAVSLVYAKIIEFLLMSVRWYKRGKLASSLYAIGKPFSVGFKPIVEELMERSRRVDELASAASKAEIRDLHVSIRLLNTTVVQLTERIAVQQQQQALHNQSLLSLQDEYKHMFRKGQIDEIRNKLLLDSKGTTSDDSLAYCRSLRNRRRQRMPTQLPSVSLSTLKLWIADPTSSLLLAQGNGVRTSSLDFAADFIDAVLECGYPILWALPSMAPQGWPDGGDDDRGSAGAPEEDARPSISGILRSLISQALALDPHIVGEGSHPITAKHFKTASDIEQWFQLLERCMAAFPRLFVVLDLGFIERAAEHIEAEHKHFRVTEFVESLGEMVRRRGRGGLKVVVISWQLGVATSMDAAELFEDRQIFTDMGRRVERLMRQPKYRAAHRRRNEQFALRLRASFAQPED